MIHTQLLRIYFCLASALYMHDPVIIALVAAASCIVIHNIHTYFTY